jgi:hypothetical protein
MFVASNFVQHTFQMMFRERLLFKISQGVPSFHLQYRPELTLHIMLVIPLKLVTQILVGSQIPGASMAFETLRTCRTSIKAS